MALVNVDVTFQVPDTIINNGGLELYAGFYGWKAQIPDPDNEGQSIANPETALDFIKGRIKEYVKQDYKKAYVAVKGDLDTGVRVQEVEAVLSELG